MVKMMWQVLWPTVYNASHRIKNAATPQFLCYIESGASDLLSVTTEQTWKVDCCVEDTVSSKMITPSERLRWQLSNDDKNCHCLRRFVDFLKADFYFSLYGTSIASLWPWPRPWPCLVGVSTLNVPFCRVPIVIVVSVTVLVITVRHGTQERQ